MAIDRQWMQKTTLKRDNVKGKEFPKLKGDNFLTFQIYKLEE